MAVATVRTPAIPRTTPAQLAKYFAAKLSAELGPHNLKRLMDHTPNEIAILDVRTREGYHEGHIPGAINIPFEELPTRAKELPKSKDLIIYCWDVTCILCTKAAFVLAKKGYRAKELLGGIEEWKRVGFPVEK